MLQFMASVLSVELPHLTRLLRLFQCRRNGNSEVPGSSEVLWLMSKKMASHSGWRMQRARPTRASTYYERCIVVWD